MHDFAELWPEKFCNVTNGVTPRRFVAVSNPRLAALITERIGDNGYVLTKPGHDIAVGPASLILQGLGKIPVIQSHPGFKAKF